MIAVLLAIVLAALAYFIAALLGLPQVLCVIVFLLVLILFAVGGPRYGPRV